VSVNQVGNYKLKEDDFFRGIKALIVQPAVDCFANVLNTKCPRFFAPTLTIWRGSRQG
jgi:hypothetical protein